MSNDHIPSTLYSVDKDGFLLDSSGSVMGLAFSDLTTSGLLPQQTDLALTSLTLIEVSPFVSAIEMTGTGSVLVGYLFADDFEAETGECIDGGNCILAVTTMTMSGRTFDYIITGRPDAVTTPSNTRDEPPNYRKYLLGTDDDDIVRLAQELFRDGRRWRELYALNRDIINAEAEARGLPLNNPRDIFPGLTLKIPRR